ncbi:hypothetical protein QVD17_19445 [Tagetes erecta]|uniref:Uncharacterized protein n=1 Tax=Tagetes erecta TaxID=13708 RepID=A0AAD8KJG8_TARER|nr:hypothetical protein QVD17_19445 [Tagetes erecta]
MMCVGLFLKDEAQSNIYYTQASLSSLSSFSQVSSACYEQECFIHSSLFLIHQSNELVDQTLEVISINKSYSPG